MPNGTLETTPKRSIRGAVDALPGDAPDRSLGKILQLVGGNRVGLQPLCGLWHANTLPNVCTLGSVTAATSGVWPLRRYT